MYFRVVVLVVVSGTTLFRRPSVPSTFLPSPPFITPTTTRMIIQSYLSLFSLLTLANALTFPIKRVSNPALGLERKSLVKRTSKFQVLANAGGGDDVDLSYAPLTCSSVDGY